MLKSFIFIHKPTSMPFRKVACNKGSINSKKPEIIKIFFWFEWVFEWENIKMADIFFV